MTLRTLTEPFTDLDRSTLIAGAKQAAWMFFAFACVGGIFHVPAVGRMIGDLIA